jgi:hypothetical protein
LEHHAVRRAGVDRQTGATDLAVQVLGGLNRNPKIELAIGDQHRLADCAQRVPDRRVLQKRVLGAGLTIERPLSDSLLRNRDVALDEFLLRGLARGRWGKQQPNPAVMLRGFFSFLISPAGAGIV